MMTTLGRWLLATAVAVAMAGPVAAHHSFSMFDLEKHVTYKGTVVEFNWVNPHAHIMIKVDAGPGIDPQSVGTWDIECASTNIMGRQGWNRITLKPGDPITLVASPMKDGSKGASLFYVIKADGTRLYRDIARPKQS